MHGLKTDYCEKHGGQIPKFELTEPLDVIDTIINDLKEYTKSLVYADTALARQIEDYLKNKEIMEQKRRDKEEAKNKGLDSVEVTDQDIADYYDDVEKQKQEDVISQLEVKDEFSESNGTLN